MKPFEGRDSRFNIHESRFNVFVLLLSGFCLLSSSSFATTYYVDSGIVTNLYDGLSATVTNGHGPKIGRAHV